MGGRGGWEGREGRWVQRRCRWASLLGQGRERQESQRGPGERKTSQTPREVTQAWGTQLRDSAGTFGPESTQRGHSRGAGLELEFGHRQAEKATGESQLEGTRGRKGRKETGREEPSGARGLLSQADQQGWRGMRVDVRVCSRL